MTRCQKSIKRGKFIFECIVSLFKLGISSEQSGCFLFGMLYRFIFSYVIHS